MDGFIYRLKNKGVLIHGLRSTKSGFKIAFDPYLLIEEKEASPELIANSIRMLGKKQKKEPDADPRNWKEFNKNMLTRTKLNSLQELNKPTTRLIGLAFENKNIIFTPSFHAKKPDRGYIHKSIKEAVIIPIDVSDLEMIDALELAFSKSD